MPRKRSPGKERAYVVSVEYTIVCSMDVHTTARNATEAKQKAEEVVNDTDMMDQEVEHMGITSMHAELEKADGG